MKHTVRVVLAAAIVLAGLTLVTPQAGASTVTVNSAPSGTYMSPTHFNKALTTQQLNAAVAKATKIYDKTHPVAKPAQGGVTPDVHVSVGWGTILLTLNHNDVATALRNGLAHGVESEMFLMCGLLAEVVPAMLACGALILGYSAVFNNYLWSALRNVTYAADFNCSFTTWYCPGGIHTVFGWVIAQQDSGLNILFNFAGVPYAFEVNPYTG